MTQLYKYLERTTYYLSKNNDNNAKRYYQLAIKEYSIVSNSLYLEKDKKNMLSSSNVHKIPNKIK